MIIDVLKTSRLFRFESFEGCGYSSKITNFDPEFDKQ